MEENPKRVQGQRSIPPTIHKTLGFAGHASSTPHISQEARLAAASSGRLLQIGLTVNPHLPVVNDVGADQAWVNHRTDANTGGASLE